VGHHPVSTVRMQTVPQGRQLSRLGREILMPAVILDGKFGVSNPQLPAFAAVSGRQKEDGQAEHAGQGNAPAGQSIGKIRSHGKCPFH
jgi:hypothetical protein